MGLFSPFVNWSRSQLNNLKSTTFEFFPLGQSFGFNKVSEQDILNGGYLSNDVVYSVINKVAGVTASIPYTITKNDKPVDENDPLVQFLQNPNPNQTDTQYIQESVINLLLFGDCMSLKDVESIGFNDITLTPLPPSRVDAVRENQNSILSPVVKFIFDDLTTQRTYEAEDIVHSTFIDPSITAKQNANGLSPLQAGNLSVRALNNANIADATIFENGAPQNIVVKKANGLALTKQDADKLDAASKMRFGGAHKTGAFTAITGDAQILKVGSTPKELGTNEARVQQLRSICNLFGVNSAELNDPDNKTYSNSKESRKALYIDVCIPVLTQIMKQHEKQIFPLFGDGYKFEVDTDRIEVLNPDRQEVRKMYFEEFKAGVWTAEEYKEKLNEL